VQSSTTNPSSRSTDIDPTPTTAPHYTLVHRLLTWGVFVAIVLIGAFVVATHPVEYATSGAVVFTGSQTPFEREAATQQPVDPASQSVLSRFGDPTVVADMMARTFDSAAKQQELRDKGMKGRLVITTKTSIVSDTPDHGPVMVLTSYGADPVSTRNDVRLAMEELPKELERWQKGADPNLSVSFATVLGPKDGVREFGSKIRSAVAIVAAAALIGWSLGQIHLHATLRWMRRRQRKSAAAMGGSALAASTR